MNFIVPPDSSVISGDCFACSILEKISNCNSGYCSNACRQKSYRQSVTDKSCDQKRHMVEP